MTKTVTIEFQTLDQVNAFMSWFDGQGEQDYFTVAEMFDNADSYVESFEYDFRTNTITGKNNE